MRIVNKQCRTVFNSINDRFDLMRRNGRTAETSAQSSGAFDKILSRIISAVNNYLSSFGIVVKPFFHTFHYQRKSDRSSHIGVFGDIESQTALPAAVGI